MNDDKSKILCLVAHPSQYYIFKNIAKDLGLKHEVILVYTSKDILRSLVENDELPYKCYEIRLYKHNGLLNAAKNFLVKEYNLYKIVKKYKPKILVGTSIVLSHIGFVLGIPSLIINEDDVNVISLSAKLGYPFATNIISPFICNLGRFEKKAIKYDGYQKLAYLHPNYFQPSREIAQKYLNLEQSNFLIRLSALSAHHDVGIHGISNNDIYELINFLRQYGNVHLSSERNLPQDLEVYRLKLNPLHIHHVLSHMDLLVSDSQSMSVEASILGVPSIRISDFAGRIGVLEELEYKYQLTFGVKPSQFNLVSDMIIKNILSLRDYKLVFKQRCDKMINEKIDVVSFFVDIISQRINFRS